MPPHKYRGVTHPLIFLLIFPILLFLYALAFCISLAAFAGRVLLCCCCGKCVMHGLLIVADWLVEASIRVFGGLMCINVKNNKRTICFVLLPDDLLDVKRKILRDSDPLNYPHARNVNILIFDAAQHVKSLSHPSMCTNPQNQSPMQVPSKQMPISRYGNMANLQRALQQPVDVLSSVNITIDFPEGGFTHEELVKATNGFFARNFLGEGGFSLVHRGILSDGREVAVKQLKSDNAWGQREFKAEVDVLSRVHHRHLVQYFGCCMTQDKRMIVCEYMPNKTVDYHLHGNHEGTIGWHTRLKISIGSAKGLAYLHEECQPRIIHRDIKAANILVDLSFEAKVADFGMAKMFPDGISLIVATNLIGTRGYLAPEFSMGEIREKSDTFSFGVVLLELITGKKPIIIRSNFSEDSSPFETLANWARPLLNEALQNGNYDSLVDSRLCNIYNKDEMKRMIACAAACVRLSPQDRPLMSKVALVLAGQASPDDLFIGLN